MADESEGIWLDGISERWSAEALDTYFAPHLSELTACNAPDVPAMPDYYVTFASVQALHRTSVFETNHHLRVLAANFLRRSVIANSEYRDGCHAIREYLAWLPESTATRIHAVAVARFEGCLLQASAAQACLVTMIRMVPNGPAIYTENDGSVADRLNKLGNRIRHHHDDILAAANRRDPGLISLAPIWLTNDGVMSRKNSRTYGLTFHELAATLQDALNSARMLVHSTNPDRGDGDANGARTRINDDSDSLPEQSSQLA